MKKTLFTLLAAGALALIGWAADSTTTPAKPSPLIGTWKMDGSDREATKFITPTHFLWVWMDPKTKVITESLGGRYKHEGNSYIEIPEFGTDATKDFFGTELKFTVKLEGDKWTHVGELPGGFKIDEVWRRVK
jgi:hypothetical protein